MLQRRNRGSDSPAFQTGRIRRRSPACHASGMPQRSGRQHLLQDSRGRRSQRVPRQDTTAEKRFSGELPAPLFFIRGKDNRSGRADIFRVVFFTISQNKKQATSKKPTRKRFQWVYSAFFGFLVFSYVLLFFVRLCTLKTLRSKQEERNNLL